MSFRKSLLAIGAAGAIASLVAAVPALSARIPILTGSSGCNEASQLLACLNQTITAVNAGVDGTLGANLTAVGTTAVTTEEILQSYTLPGGTLATNGQGVRIKCWGTTGATANNKTMKLYFGSTVITTPTAATNNGSWFLTLDVYRTAAAVQNYSGGGVVATTAVAPANAATGAETLASAVTIKCTGTNGTSAINDVIANGMTVEALR